MFDGTDLAAMRQAKGKFNTLVIRQVACVGAAAVRLGNQLDDMQTQSEVLAADPFFPERYQRIEQLVMQNVG